MATGYIGVGNMGGALARRLLAAGPLTVFDLDAHAVDVLVGLGAVRAERASDVAATCDTIFLCLPTSKHVRELLLSDGGLFAHLRSGTLIVDQTSGDPNETREIAARLAADGIELVDAPVSGGPQAAAAGTIAIMVGASAASYERAAPFIRMISSNVFHVGDIGAGQVLKLVNNLISATQRILTFEGLALAASNGLELDVAMDVIMASGGRNAYLEKMMIPHVSKGDLSRGFTLELAHKDVRLACELGDASGTPMLFGNLSKEVYRMCISEMGADAKVDTAALVFERLSGATLVKKFVNQ